jgi:hypothetical protein
MFLKRRFRTSPSEPLRCGSCCALPWEIRAGREGRAEHDVSSWAERAVATTEPPPLRSLLHQVRNGMRVTVDLEWDQEAQRASNFQDLCQFRQY